MNPFQPLYDACNSGTNAAKYEALPDFPRIIDVELTSSCNFRCLMCPTGNLSLKRPAEFMEERTIERIVDAAVLHDTALRFIGWGEPLLHPRVDRIIGLARAVPTHINTNGSKLNADMAEALCDAGLKSIKFSFQGVDRATYLEMRQADFFEGMIEAIEAMVEARGGFSLPFIAASTTTTYETPEQVAEFREKLEPLVDQLTIGTTIFDYMDLDAVRLRPGDRAMLERLKALEATDKRHPEPCPEVFDKLSVHADGSVVVCCNDFNGDVDLGNVNETPIAELWRHPAIEAYRQRLVANDYSGPLCRDCYDYHKLTRSDENSQVA